MKYTPRNGLKSVMNNFHVKKKGVGNFGKGEYDSFFEKNDRPLDKKGLF